MEVLKVNLPEGWKQLKEGIVICTKKADWYDEDMWWAESSEWMLDVGTYHGVEKYVCLALRQQPYREHPDFNETWAKEHGRDPDEVCPDWQNPDERVEFDAAHEVVAWVYGWLEKMSAKSAEEFTCPSA